MESDWKKFNSRVEYDKDSNKMNPLKFNGLEDTANIKTLAEKLSRINDHATTHGEHCPVGELYGFPLLVKTEDTMKEGLFMKENRFFVEGEGNNKYTYNNGQLATEPRLAVYSFLHALEKLPTLIENHDKKIAELSKDLPILQEIANSTWRREDELKSELAALDRKIQLSLKPIDEGTDKQEQKQPKTETPKTMEVINGLVSGKMMPQNFNSSINDRVVYVK
jgi:hypothetical protein